MHSLNFSIELKNIQNFDYVCLRASPLMWVESINMALKNNGEDIYCIFKICCVLQFLVALKIQAQNIDLIENLIHIILFIVYENFTRTVKKSHLAVVS